MCGITGKLYFDKDAQVDPAELKRMTDSILHRGPDDEGHYFNGNIGLGFRRLSIIDLALGHQPMPNHDESIWITFNGEIYNFQELRKGLEKKGYTFRNHTDTEVIVHLYEEYGESCVDYLRGMFAIVIWDDRKKLLFGVRDRLGIKPFYYYHDNQQFIWGSEIKAILAAQKIDKEVNLKALDSYFAFGYITKNRSIYNKIRKLEPGHSFTIRPFENKKIEFRKYWNISFEPDYFKDEGYWKERIMTTLQESVKMRMIADVPLGAFLSGGIDSSSVVALMSLVSNRPVKTFSIGFKEEKYNELKYARLIAEKYKTEHHEMIIEPESVDLLPKLVHAYDEPYADSSAIPTYYVSKFAKEFVTVVLSGDGGDELFAGYDAFAKMMKFYKQLFNNGITNKLAEAANYLIPDYLYGKGYSYYLSKKKSNIGAYFCFWKDYERRNVYTSGLKNELSFRAENDKLELLGGYECDFLSRMQQLHMETYLVDDILTKVDRASMMNSLEARVPILDHKFAELSFRIPSDLKLKGDNKKYILKEAMRPVLPDQIISHHKQGFSIPLKIWFKDDLKQYAYDTLTGPSFMLSNYIDPKKVKTIIDYHQKGMRDYSAKVWSLLFLNEWLKQNK